MTQEDIREEREKEKNAPPQSVKTGKSGKKRWRDVFETSMSAVAFAEANAPEVAKEILAQGEAPKESVLFVVHEGHLHRRALQYAMNLCERMNCALTVLHILSDQEHDEPALEGLELTLRKISRIPSRRYTMRGPISDVVRRFLQEHRRILSVVMDDISRGKSQPSRRRAKQRPWWQDASCPVIFISAT